MNDCAPNAVNADDFTIISKPTLARLLAEATRDGRAEVLDILRELVDLKDGPRGEDYERRKPAAWDAARRLVRGGE